MKNKEIKCYDCGETKDEMIRVTGTEEYYCSPHCFGVRYHHWRYSCWLESGKIKYVKIKEEECTTL